MQFLIPMLVGRTMKVGFYVAWSYGLGTMVTGQPWDNGHKAMLIRAIAFEHGAMNIFLMPWGNDRWEKMIS